MAVIFNAFRGAFQRGAFQLNAFQVGPNTTDYAGDIAAPQEIAFFERQRERWRREYEEDLRLADARRRALDDKIDEYLSARAGADGERDESDIPKDQRELLADAVSATQPRKPKPTPQPLAEPTEFGRNLRALALPKTPERTSPESAEALQGLKQYAAEQGQQQADVLQQLHGFRPAKGDPAQLQALVAADHQHRAEALNQLAAMAPAHMSPAQVLALAIGPARLTPEQLQKLMATQPRTRISPADIPQNGGFDHFKQLFNQPSKQDLLLAALAQGKRQLAYA